MKEGLSLDSILQVLHLSSAVVGILGEKLQLSKFDDHQANKTLNI